MNDQKLAELAMHVQEMDSRLLALESRVDEAHLRRLTDREVTDTREALLQSQLNALRETLEAMTERANGLR